MIRIYEPRVATNQRKYLNECVDTNMLTFHGRFEKEFAKRLASFFDVKHAILTNSGTTALHALYHCLSLQNKKVATSNITYAATVNQLHMVGSEVYLIDTDERGQLDLYKFQEACKLYSFDALVVPGVYHDSPDMEFAQYLCKKNDIMLIEDAAEVFGCSQQGQMLGTFGTAGTFSFFGNKLITCGEGGCVVTNDDDLADKIRLFINHNTIGPYVHDGAFCSNYRMTNLQAAVGLAQLEDYNEVTYNKNQIYKKYKRELSWKLISPDCQSSHWLNIAYHENPKGLIEQGKQSGVEFRRMFHPIHMQPNWPEMYYTDLKKSIWFWENHVCLPSGPNLTDKDILEVLKVYENSKTP